MQKYIIVVISYAFKYLSNYKIELDARYCTKT